MEKIELQMLQALPLEIKIKKTLLRIEEFVRYFGEENVYISFSGGKDSTVLLHLVRSIYPNIPAVFSNKGVEFPEVIQRVKTFPNVEIIRPTKSFAQILKEYGYPVVSKKVARALHDLKNPTPRNERSRKWSLSKWRLDKEGNELVGQKNTYLYLADKWRYLIDAPFNIGSNCCYFLKKKPLKQYLKESGKHPIIGTLADECFSREKEYLNRGGCNTYGESNGMCQPLGFWTEQDILQYIYENDIKIPAVYGDIVKEEYNGATQYRTTREDRTGCIYCLFGIQFEKGYNRIQRLQITHPKLHKYCLDKLGYREVMDFMEIPHTIPEHEIESATAEIFKNPSCNNSCDSCPLKCSKAD